MPERYVKVSIKCNGDKCKQDCNWYWNYTCKLFEASIFDRKRCAACKANEVKEGESA